MMDELIKKYQQQTDKTKFYLKGTVIVVILCCVVTFVNCSGYIMGRENPNNEVETSDVSTTSSQQLAAQEKIEEKNSLQDQDIIALAEDELAKSNTKWVTGHGGETYELVFLDNSNANLISSFNKESSSVSYQYSILEAEIQGDIISGKISSSASGQVDGFKEFDFTITPTTNNEALLVTDAFSVPLTFTRQAK